MSREKIIVTGGAGFIGSHLAKKLVERDNDVHVVDDLSFGDRARVPEAAVLHELDIRETGILTEVMRGARVVYHLAAISSVILSIEDPVRVSSVNVLGTLSVLDAARRAGVRRVVYSSSSAVYGDQLVEALREDLPAAPQSPYGLSKYVGELSARMFSELYGLETACLRYFNVYGAGQDPNGPYAAVIARFAEARKAGRALQVVGDGDQTRDFIMVDDVVLANIAAARATHVGKGEAFNIGTGVSTRIVNLARLISANIEFVPKRQEIRNSKADIARARERLGFEFTVALDEGLKRMGL